MEITGGPALISTEELLRRLKAADAENDRLRMGIARVAHQVAPTDATNAARLRRLLVRPTAKGKW